MNDKIETVDEILNRLKAYDDIKRERDEAHALLDDTSDRIEQLNGLCNLLRDERDEAIARSKEWSDWCVEYKSERDELREVLREILKVSEPTPVLTYQKMEDIASKALKETK